MYDALNARRDLREYTESVDAYQIAILYDYSVVRSFLINRLINYRRSSIFSDQTAHSQTADLELHRPRMSEDPFSK